MAITVEQLEVLEKKQMFWLRRLMCGKACIKTTISDDNVEHFRYRALTNEAVRTALRNTTI